MATKMVQLRFPLDLLERVDRARGEEPRTRFVFRALEGVLESEEAAQYVLDHAPENIKRSIPCEEVKQMGKTAMEQIRKENPIVRASELSRERVLRCPSSGCDFQAPSPNARCPKHGRRVR